MEWIFTCTEKVMHTHQGTLIVVKQKVMHTHQGTLIVVKQKVMHTHQGTLIVVKQNHKSSQIKKTMDNTN